MMVHTAILCVIHDLWCLLQTPSVTCEGSALPGSVESSMPGYIPRFLEGQSAVTIKYVSCGDLFTACLTGNP